MPDNNARVVIARLLTHAAQVRREAGLPVDPEGHQHIELAECLEDYAYQLLQERSGSTSTYRVFFRNEHGICGRDDFDVDDDDTAFTIAALLADVCSDQCTNFDLWQGTRLIRRIQRLPPQPRVSLSELSEKHQALVVEREEAIRNSDFAIASSRRLLRRLDEVRRKP
jgi:hypothetical protein